MRSIILILLIIFINQFQYGQDFLINGKVINEFGEGIGLVNVGIVNKPYGTITKDNGFFQVILEKNKIDGLDSVRFSMIGYYPKTFGLKDILGKELSVGLKEKIEEFKEVEIKYDSDNYKIIKSNSSIVSATVNFLISKFPDQNLGSEIGKRFRIKEKNTTLKKLQFGLIENDFDTIRFRLNVYSIKKNKPFENILRENILIEVNNKKTGYVDFDLSPYNIVVDSDIIVGLEWVYKTENGTRLGMPLTYPTKQVHYYKFGSQDKWKIFKSLSSFINLEIKF